MRRLTAWNFFVSHESPLLKDGKMDGKSLMQILSTRWKSMTPEEKEPYYEKQKNDVQLGRKWTNKKRPHEPTRPCSAYALYLGREIGTVKKDNPEYTHREHMQIVAQNWRDLDESSKNELKQEAQERTVVYLSTKRFKPSPSTPPRLSHTEHRSEELSEPE